MRNRIITKNKSETKDTHKGQIITGSDDPLKNIHPE